MCVYIYIFMYICSQVPPPAAMVSPFPGPAVPHNRHDPTQTRGREDDGECSLPVLLHGPTTASEQGQRHHLQGQHKIF